MSKLEFSIKRIITVYRRFSLYFFQPISAKLQIFHTFFFRFFSEGSIKHAVHKTNFPVTIYSYRT